MNGKYEAWASYTLFILVAVFFGLLITSFPSAYVWATYEDLVGEWTQWYFFFAALFFSLRLALARSPHRIFYAALSLACFYVLGEEISWGQRIFDIATPDFFTRHNLQQETNLHNFFTGPYRTGLKRVIEIVLAAGFILYGGIYPLTLRSGWKAALLLSRFGLPAPPVHLWPFFAAAAILELRFFTFNEAEIAEILLALALALFTLSAWQQHTRDRAPDNRSPRQRILPIVFLFLAGTGLGAATTAICYQTPHLRADMDKRIEGGMKKFGQRYGRIGYWSHAAGLYQRLHEKNRKDIEILRDLAHCRRELGEEEKFRDLIGRAIQLDMTGYGRNPADVAVNLSLVKSLRQAGFNDKADFHLQKALASGKKNAMLEPYSAGAAYWLSRSYLAAGDLAAALRELEKAVYLKPESIFYKKALARLTLQQKYESDGEEAEREG